MYINNNRKFNIKNREVNKIIILDYCKDKNNTKTKRVHLKLILRVIFFKYYNN